MKNFNFSNLGDTSFTNNGPQYLRPYDIYEVTLNKVEQSILKGKDGTEYPVVSLEFKGCGDINGVYSHNLFVPTRDSDFERRVNETSGSKYPSAFEQYQYTLMQLAEVINPTSAQKIKDNASKIKSLEQFTELIVKALSNKSDVKFFIKLVGRISNNVTYSTIPNACILTSDATAETRPIPLNFVSHDKTMLSFSNYEMSQMKKYKSAKPTPMPNDDENPDISSDSELDITDLDV